jgi:tetratricopeptide (TPR) repeat protein
MPEKIKYVKGEKVVIVDNMIGDINVTNINITNEIAMSAAIGILEILAQEQGEANQEVLLSYLGNCQYDPTLNVEQQQKATELYQQIEQLTPEELEDFFTPSESSNRKHRRLKRNLGFLVLGIAVGYAGQSLWDIYQDSKKEQEQSDSEDTIPTPSPTESKFNDEPDTSSTSDPFSANIPLTYYRVGRAEAYRVIGHQNEAITEFDQAIQFTPNNAELFLLRSSMYLEMGDDSAAQADYYQAIELNPSLQSSKSYNDDPSLNDDASLTPVSSDEAQHIIDTAHHNANRYTIGEFFTAVAGIAILGNLLDSFGLGKFFEVQDINEDNIADVIPDYDGDYEDELSDTDTDFDSDFDFGFD